MRQRQDAQDVAFLLVTLFAYFAGTSLGLLVAWPRYFVPTIALGTLLSGMGASVLAGRLMRALMSVANHWTARGEVSYRFKRA
jgi:hypothetical protein